MSKRKRVTKMVKRLNKSHLNLGFVVLIIAFGALTFSIIWLFSSSSNGSIDFSFEPYEPRSEVTFYALTTMQRVHDYRWEFGDGGQAEGIQVSHTYSKPGEYQVSLAITDSRNRTHKTSKKIAVLANAAPVANAGPDKVVESFIDVMLQGGLSYDPDGDPIKYRWEQVAGPEVKLMNKNSQNPAFEPPFVLSDTSVRYVFELQVIDSWGATDKDSVEIIVKGSPRLYWTDPLGGKINVLGIQSRHARTPFQDADRPLSIALDHENGKLYWSTQRPATIKRANLDGTNVEEIISDIGVVFGIALDLEGKKLYWVDRREEKIQRSNLDGSEIEKIASAGKDPRGLAVDTKNKKIYWSDRRSGTIRRANLDGSGTEDVVVGLDYPHSIALDIPGGKLYWTDKNLGKIQRSNLDGSSVEDFLNDLDDPRALLIDLYEGKLYWSIDTKIQRSNIDGSDIETIFTIPRYYASGFVLVR